MQLPMRVVERINQPITYASIQSNVRRLESDLQHVDRNVQISLGKVSIVQNDQVEEYLADGRPWKNVMCQGYSDEKMQWFADITVTSSNQNLIDELRVHPYDNSSMLAFVLEPLKFGE